MASLRVRFDMNKILLPPQENKFATTFTKLILPAILKQNNLDVSVSSSCVDAVRLLNGMSTVILMNHTDRFDPLCAFALSSACDEDFFYIASREQFDSLGGFRGWCMQQVGAYSVVRGEPEDYASKELTTSLIAEGRRKLVMFPEGDVTGRDDAILPMKEDGVRNMLAAQERLLHSGRDVYLLPISIYYRLCTDAVPRLNESLDRLEDFLRLPILRGSFETRIKRIVEVVLSELAVHYGANLRSSQTDQQLLEVCRHVSTSIAAFFGIECASGDPMVVLHTVRGQLWRMINSGSRYGSEYSIKLSSEIGRSGRALLKDLDRMEQLLILAHTLQQDEFSLEEAWRIIDRLESEILGKASKKGHRTVRMEAAPPISLKDYVRRDCQEDTAVHLVDHQARKALFGALQHAKKTAHLPRNAKVA